MARSLGNIIADSLKMGLQNGERMLVGVPAEQFARFARPGGDLVVSNHPAFIYGHLSLYGARIVEQLGVDASAIRPSEQFVEVFSKDAECRDDPDSSIYPPMEEVTAAFFNAYHRAAEVLSAIDDEALQQPNPAGGRMMEKFPTLGSMHAFYAGGHLMLHIGQMSAWRRMVGIGAA